MPDIYGETRTNVFGETMDFTVKVSVFQALSPYLFSSVMDELTKGAGTRKNTMVLMICFLINKNINALENKLEC